MEIKDPVYGDKKIQDPVIKQLIQSDPFQRLKNIQQSGPVPYFTDRKSVTRYQHSLGVFILLDEYNASREELIAGLIHDVPHTAFSHLVDFVFENEGHDYHENFLEKMVYDTEISEILQTNNIDIDYVLEENNFRLLERDMPNLCADRIDYFLRDMKVVRNKKVNHMLKNLIIHENEFLLDDKDIAEEYALQFIETDQKCWANPKEVAVNELFAQIIRKGFEIGSLKEEDLFMDDNQLLDKIKHIENDFVQKKLSLLNQGFEIEQVTRAKADFSVTTKARYVDPKVRNQDGSIQRVSNYSDGLKKSINEHKEKVSKGYNIKII